MIKFFRRIRQKLLSENRFSKYLIYAIGEILLVMVGILMALQVNNWNEERKISGLEIEYLKGLGKDFKIALSDLDFNINRANESVRNTDSLLLYTGPDSTKIGFSKFIEHALLAHHNALIYKYNSGYFEDLVSSGNLNSISNKSLRLLLTEWKQQYTRVLEMQERLLLTHKSLRDLEIDDFDLRMGLANHLSIAPSKFNLSSLQLLQNKAYENNLTIYLIELKSIIKHYYNPLREINVEIIETISNELEDF